MNILFRQYSDFVKQKLLRPTHRCKHICKEHKADTQRLTLQKSFYLAGTQEEFRLTYQQKIKHSTAQATFHRWTYSTNQNHFTNSYMLLFGCDEGHEGNMEFGKIRADGSRVSSSGSSCIYISSLTLKI